jgi:protein-S-isoprenylcysteine O-methyltransferase Ste14
MISLRAAVAAVVATVVYLGLAILGWGGFHAFFAHRALTTLVVVTVVLTVLAFFTGGNLSSGEREDRGNRWVLVMVTILGLLSGYFPALTDRLDFLTLDGDSVRWVGVVLYGLGGALRLWPVFVLGRRFSGLVAIQRDHELCTGRIYSVIRHPSYLGLIVMLFGWGLAYRSSVGVVLAILTIIPLLARIRAEERLLHTQFGAEYEAYRQRTPWRLLPGVY